MAPKLLLGTWFNDIARPGRSCRSSLVRLLLPRIPSIYPIFEVSDSKHHTTKGFGGSETSKPDTWTDPLVNSQETNAMSTHFDELLSVVVVA